MSVNHGTTAYAELLLRSLLAHHRDRPELSILLLDNGSSELGRLEWAKAYGVEIRPSGYSLDAPITTHGEILRDAVRATPGCDTYLFVDSDVCFVADNTIQAMPRELFDDPSLFAVQAIWSLADGSTYDPTAYVSGQTSRVRESVRLFGQDEWGEPSEWDIGYTDRVHPFCTLVRNDTAFRITVDRTLACADAMRSRRQVVRHARPPHSGHEDTRQNLAHVKPTSHPHRKCKLAARAGCGNGGAKGRASSQVPARGLIPE